MKKHQTESKSLINKVSQVTILFWVIKILSTTVGETTADFFSHALGSISIALFGTLLLIAAFIQMRFKQYVPWMYWTVIVFIAIFGTLFADGLHHAGIPLGFTTLIFATALSLLFALWYACEKTLDVHNIHTTRREIFYWLVILFTFALGTAAGDFLAHGFQFGFMKATLVFGIIMVIVPIILYRARVNSVVLFWASYILTRPFGASGGDLLSHPVNVGGFGWGTGTTSLIFLGMVIALIIYVTITHKKEMDDAELL
ncbi:MAG TPA: hypothetical protein VGV92_00725 [Gammaproteobacteria bacterium]|nr:hypothetical protein [Gammaproteobacteria bacterium]